ncbi:histidine protein methyltransferase 1 homolog [Thalassophryne amazonica]|uniref:histidine protein methyltransferase 1 homolog n=1 Tax=Thalassophryne amazonica TaxID=390379 RepID=UPI00147259CB|nr:histidine protein methyltransferase 1 homolog [Thalassophryne amazonica]
MSFSFNFDVHSVTPNRGGNSDGHELQHVKEERVGKHMVDNTKPAASIKEAKEHHPVSDPQYVLHDVSETVTIGSLPPLHFLNEAVFEKTASEKDDVEKILSCTAEQSSDLISGVYEGGLKVWECTYDLLELIEKDSKSFGEKRVLDLGCGAGLLGILALKTGAKHVHFQDYNSTVIEHLTLPNVILNCLDDGNGEDAKDREDNGKLLREYSCENEVNEKQEDQDWCPPSKKTAMDPTQQPSLARCRFFSGDWTTFLALLLKEDPPPIYDIILTSETIYNTAYYPTLHETLHSLLAPDGLIYLATKSHYFGVGGGLHLFEKFVAQRDVFSLEHVWDLDEGLQRHIVVLRFKTATLESKDSD